MPLHHPKHYKDIITPHAMKQLSYKQCNILNKIGITELITKGFMTVEMALNLTAKKRNRLNSKNIAPLITNHLMPIEMALILTPSQSALLKNEKVMQALWEGRVLINDALLHKLTPALCELISNNHIPFEVAMGLGQGEWNRLNLPGVKELILTTNTPIRGLFLQPLYKLSVLESEFVRTAIISRKLSLNAALNLSTFQYRVLCSEAIQHHIKTKRLSISQALALSSNQFQNLESDLYHLFVQQGHTMNDLLDITAVQRADLTDQMIRTGIDRGLFNFEDVLSSRVNIIPNINSPYLQKLLNQGEINPREFIACPENIRLNYDSQILLGLRRARFITTEQLAVMPPTARQALSVHFIRELFTNRRLNLDNILQMQPYQIQTLSSGVIQGLFRRGAITIQQIAGIQPHQITFFESPYIHALQQNGALTVANILSMSTLSEHLIRNPNQIPLFVSTMLSHVQSTTIKYLLERRELTTEQLQRMSVWQREYIENHQIILFIQQRHISVEQFLNLPSNKLQILASTDAMSLLSPHDVLNLNITQAENLNRPAIITLIKQNIIPLEFAKRLHKAAAYAFTCAGVQTLLNEKKITLQQISEFRLLDQGYRLNCPEVVEKIKRGTLTVDRALTEDNRRVIPTRSEHLQNYIRQGILTEQELSDLNGSDLFNLQCAEVQELMRDRLITIEHIKKIACPDKRSILEDFRLGRLLRSGRITFAHLLTLRSGQIDDSLESIEEEHAVAQQPYSTPEVNQLFL